jgi:GrpB-like predicted nucleotidyltransferase (UPF0157 family)
VTVPHFRPEAELWPLVDRAFQRHSREIRTLVPSATVEHVGATAVPGSLARDLDLLVRVPGDAFDAAAAALAGRYEPHGGAAFADETDDELPVHVTLAVEGSETAARILELRRVLRSSPDLVKRGNELRRRHEGGDAAAYEAEKQAFYADFL